LAKCQTSECAVTVYSVRIGSPTGKTVPLFSREQVAEALLSAAPEAPAQQEDPCPGCIRGGVCKTPECGRLKLPVDHPLRTGEAPAQAEVLRPNGEPWDPNPDGIKPGQESSGPRMDPNTGHWDVPEDDEAPAQASQPTQGDPCFCDRMYPKSNPDASCGDCPKRDYKNQPTQGDAPSDADQADYWRGRAIVAERALRELRNDTQPATNEAEQAGEREAFETWVEQQPEAMKKQWWCRQIDDGGYSCHEPDVMWRAWQARAALQRTEQSAQQRSERMQAVRDFIRADADLARGITKKEG
jgi:hypothetical protein